MAVTKKRDMKLIILMEECGELVQATSKMLRFGSDEVSRKTDKPTIHSFKEELKDVLAIIWDLQQCGFLPKELMTDEEKVWRVKKLENTLETSRLLGRLK